MRAGFGRRPRFLTSGSGSGVGVEFGVSSKRAPIREVIGFMAVGSIALLRLVVGPL